MSPTQYQWFEDGSGCGGAGSCWMSASAMLEVIQMIAVVAVLLFVTWVCLKAYDNWAQEQIRPGDMIFIWARSVFVLMVILYLIIN